MSPPYEYIRLINGNLSNKITGQRMLPGGWDQLIFSAIFGRAIKIAAMAVKIISGIIYIPLYTTE